MEQRVIDAGLNGEWTSDGNVHIGKCVTREFKRRKIDGVVTSWIPPGATEGDNPIYHVEHDDGDAEDLDEAELDEGLRAFERKAPTRQSDRVPFNEAKALSATEVDPRDAVPQYRPFDELSGVLERTRALTPASEPVAIAGLPRDGPFERCKDEMSAERKLDRWRLMREQCAALLI